jgi:26S proteasome regulatory subunit N9
MLNDVKNSLEALPDVDAKVLASLSQTYATYYRRKEDHENFYKNSLQFLAYTPSNELTLDEKKEWSTKIGMAVLLGKNIYNITELVKNIISLKTNYIYFSWTKTS